jgi:hypothetical protein
MQTFTKTVFVLISAYGAATAAEAEQSSTPLPQKYCPQDIAISKVDGVTSYPDTQDGNLSAPVEILSQDVSSVTVELRQQWFPSVASIHYAFQERHSYTRCHKEKSVPQGEVYDRITIECNNEDVISQSPWGHLEVCLSDDSPNENLLEGDQAILPQSCQKVRPGIDYATPESNEEPTVCYSLQIRCESSCVEEQARNRRGLRGPSSNSSK